MEYRRAAGAKAGCGCRTLSFGPFLFAQVEHECDALVAAPFEQRAANQHGDAAAILAEILLLERPKSPACAEFRHRAVVLLAPLGRREIRPAHTTRHEVFTVVPHDGEKRVIRLENPTVEVPNANPQNVGVNQAADPRFAFREIAVQPAALERNRGLRGEQLQHRGACRREDARSMVVLEIQHSDEFDLVHERQAEHRPSVPLNDIRIR